MGYDKEKLSKLLNLVTTVYNDKGPEVKEFAAGINALALSDIKNKEKIPIYPAEKLDDIYEYCLMRNLDKQAHDFYKNLPFVDIKDDLIQDFKLMEEARRRNNFPVFCLRLFRQIEAILTNMSQDPLLDEMAHRMFEHVMYGGKTSDNTQEKTVVDFIYGKYRYDKGTGKDNSLSPLRNQYVNNKFAIIEFFVGMKYNVNNKYFPSNTYKERKDGFYKLTTIRNLAHGDPWSKFSDNQKKVCNEVLSLQAEYYFKFSALLVDFMTEIQGNYPLSPEEYAMKPLSM